MRKALLPLLLAIICFLLALGNVYKGHQIRKLDERVASLEAVTEILGLGADTVSDYMRDQNSISLRLITKINAVEAECGASNVQ